ncbi:hypothetical protein J1N35_012002, partial [Gossypium stocksii]
LKAKFEYLSSTANEWEVMQAVRAYIIHLIGGVLMPNANGNTVHLIWSTNLGIERSYTVPIYCLMIENHAGERPIGEGTSDGSYFGSVTIVRVHTVVLPLPLQYSRHSGSYPPQYFAPSGPYPPPYSITSGSSSSMAFETYDFSCMFRTPPHVDEENVDQCNRP